MTRRVLLPSALLPLALGCGPTPTSAPPSPSPATVAPVAPTPTSTPTTPTTTPPPTAPAPAEKPDFEFTADQFAQECGTEAAPMGGQDAAKKQRLANKYAGKTLRLTGWVTLHGGGDVGLQTNVPHPDNPKGKLTVALVAQNGLRLAPNVGAFAIDRKVVLDCWYRELGENGPAVEVRRRVLIETTATAAVYDMRAIHSGNLDGVNTINSGLALRIRGRVEGVSGANVTLATGVTLIDKPDVTMPLTVTLKDAATASGLKAGTAVVIDGTFEKADVKGVRFAGGTLVSSDPAPAEPIRVTAEELTKAIAADPVAARAKYDRLVPLLVTGKVVNIQPLGGFIQLAGHEDGVRVTCNMLPKAELERVKEGATVTVQMGWVSAAAGGSFGGRPTKLVD